MATAGSTRGAGPERAYIAAIPSSGTVRLDAEEGHHLVRARRARVGDAVVLFDGRGASVLARLLDADAKAPSLAIVGPYPDREPARAVTIASAVPGPSRLDDLVTSLAELGVTTWVPLLCERSDRDAVEGLTRRRERLDRLVREAAKVSGRSRVLDIGAPTVLSDITRRSPASDVFLLDPDPTVPTLISSLQSMPPTAPVLALVGPEGGFTELELRWADGTGVRRVSLTACALRTELAAIAAAVISLAGS